LVGWLVWATTLLYADKKQPPAKSH